MDLKAQFAEAGIDLVVQEDFAESGSPYGTLLKIFAEIKQCDMVVQILGSIQSNRVPLPVCEEVLNARPDFRRWLQQRGVLSAFRAGAISYVEFEGYSALFLKKELFLLQYRSGTQSEYEARLRKLGRHVEAKLDKIESLLARVQEQLQQIELVGRKSSEQREQGVERKSTLGLIAIIAFSWVLAFLIQLHHVGLLASTAASFAIARELTYFMASVLAYVLVQCAIITDQLRFDFIAKTAIRNASAILSLFALLGFLSFQAIQWFAAIGNSWPWLLAVSTLLTVLGFITNPIKQKRWYVWAFAVPFNFALVMLIFLSASFFAKYPTVFHWVWIVIGFIVLSWKGFNDNQVLQLEIEHGTSNLTPGIKERKSQFFWTARQTVMDAKKVEDLGHDF